MKKCSACKLLKPYEEFNKCTSKADGHCNFCRDCGKSQNKKWYMVNGAKKKHKLQSLRHEINGYIDLFKIACTICSESEKCCLEFHHLDPASKSFELSKCVNLDKKAILKEIQKCLLVCANCHRLIEAKELQISEEALIKWKNTVQNVIDTIQ